MSDNNQNKIEDKSEQEDFISLLITWYLKKRKKPEDDNDANGY